MSGDDLLHTKQVAEEYGLNYSTLRYWRSANTGPHSFTLGPRGRVVYRRSDVEHWIAQMEQATRRGGDDLERIDAPA
jgi:predicted DNA-binding transcriptional regulator AlpA